MVNKPEYLEEPKMANSDALPILARGKRLLIAHPHGFCAGVDRAVKSAETLLQQFAGETVYCLNEIVHNHLVVSRLQAAGMVFVRSLEEVPLGAVVMFSAHGVAPVLRELARQRQLRVVDATCPFVNKVHAEVRRFANANALVICIGHHTHEEVIGIVGEAPGQVKVVQNAQEAEMLQGPDGQQIAVVTQTTLSAEQVESVMCVLRRRFPELWAPRAADVCYATQNRQEAVRVLAQHCTCILVLGATNSSNSLRLVETARACGVEAHLISNLTQLKSLDLEEEEELGLTSGASTPEEFLDEVVQFLQEQYDFPAPEPLVAVEEELLTFNLVELPATNGAING